MTAIILHTPQMGENIGAAARAMLNFGLTDLRLVAPRDGWPNPKALEMAAGAKKLIVTAKIFATTTEAIADLQFVYACTARPRDMDKTSISATEVAPVPNCGVLFGCERSGLENADIALANAIVHIPVSDGYPSLNLAQAVAIICYELQKKPVITPPREIASKAEYESMFGHLAAELARRNFFQTPEKKQNMLININSMLTRAEFSGQEIRTMRGIIRCLSEHQEADNLQT